jgi:hypothetical protein
MFVITDSIMKRPVYSTNKKEGILFRNVPFPKQFVVILKATVGICLCLTNLCQRHKESEREDAKPFWYYVI